MDLVVELPVGTGEVRRYVALAKVGGGSFGDILAAVAEEDPEDWVALKVEGRYQAEDAERKQSNASMVRFEQLVCGEIVRCAPVCPCPRVRGCVSLHNDQDVLAMELLGPNLRDYAAALDQWPLPPELVLVLGASLVGRLEQLHSCGFVHRDLKPENILVRLEPEPSEGPIPCFVLADYAMAMRFAWPSSGGLTQHVEERRDSEVAGTHRYMAVHAQRGVTQSRRSDLESLAYVLIYLTLGALPWQHKDANSMLAEKERTHVPELCRKLPPAFGEFLKRCRDLQFDEQPEYASLQMLLLRGAAALARAIDFRASSVRRGFRRELQDAFFRKETERYLTALIPARARSPRALPSVVPVFVRHGGTPGHVETELVARRPSRAADLDDKRCFFFEAYTEQLPGTVHVVVGACHFFGFFQQKYLLEAHAEAGLPGTGAEQLNIYSLSKRDLVIRDSTLREFQQSDPGIKEYNLRCTFWARVLLPWDD